MAYVIPRNGMTTEEVKSLLKRTLKIPQKLRATPFLWGPYGIGKSEIVRQVAKELCEELTTKYIAEGRQDELFEIVDENGQTRMVAFDPVPVDIRLALKDAGDIQGLPTFHIDRNGVKRTTWAIPDCFPSDPNWRGIIFFDEFNLGQMSVINACYQVLTEFQLEAIKFNPGVLIVCAGNDSSYASNAIDLPQGINTRVNHIDMVANFDCWAQWAMDAGINPELVTYLKTHQNKFYDFDALNDGLREICTPRTWTRVSAFLDIKDYDIETYLIKDIQGLVGFDTATNFLSYLKDKKKYQDPDDILVKGKPFESESTEMFFGCFVNCIYKITQYSGAEFDKAFNNLYVAYNKLQNKELKAFCAKSFTNNKKINHYLENEKPEILLKICSEI